MKLLEDAVKSDTASQETIDSAMTSISAMANCSMKVSQLANKLLAKDFSDCVVYYERGLHNRCRSGASRRT